MDAIGGPAAALSTYSGDACGESGAPRLPLDLRDHAARVRDAMELVELGGRAGLIAHATGLERRAVNRLYRQLRGAPSPPGQTPFTDTWYLENDLRMLHASIVWRLHRQLTPSGRSAARVLIDVYSGYRALVRTPVLDMTHAAFVPRLVEMKNWEERRCALCTCIHVAPLLDGDDECPGCRLYHRHRCRACDRPIDVRRGRGRKRVNCDPCRLSSMVSAEPEGG